MISETGMPEQYCLRWNNHKTNLLTVFGELFRNEDFTDVTLACEGGSFIKCHKMVLAACSSYFQCLFSELPYRHPVVVLKDVRYSEIQAILEYMYKGEVSVTVEEVEPLLKVAEALRVKGLAGENNHKSRTPPEEYNTISTSSAYGIRNSRESSLHREQSNVRRHNAVSPNDLRDNLNLIDNTNITESRRRNSNPSSNNSSGNGNADGNGSVKNEDSEILSPPHSTSIHHQPFQKASYLYGKSQEKNANLMSSLPLWTMSGIPLTTSTPHTSTNAMFTSCYETAAVIAAGSADIITPFKKRRSSNFYMNRDTPILRTVLGQGQADSSQPMSLVCHNDGQDQTPQSNGPSTPQDGSYNAEMNEMLHSPSSSPQSYYSDSRGGVSSAIATYVPSQKPEWKRYKQYTRNDISNAIDAVRNGMSALQAAKKYHVPSRTLYDKVKKLGITTSRPLRRSNGSNGAAFPYGVTGTGSGMMMNFMGDDESGQGVMLEHNRLLQALEIGDKLKIEGGDREALSSTPPTTIASISQSFLQRALEDDRVKSELVERDTITMAQGGGGTLSGNSSSSPPGDRSPSPNPNLIKYAQRSHSLTPSPPSEPGEDEYEDQVEDLSMTRKPDQHSRVIMPPMNQAAATMLATCSEGRRE